MTYLHLSMEIGDVDAHYSETAGKVVLNLGSGAAAVHLDGPAARKLAARLDSAADMAAMAGITAGQDQFADAGKTSQMTDRGGC